MVCICKNEIYTTANRDKNIYGVVNNLYVTSDGTSWISRGFSRKLKEDHIKVNDGSPSFKWFKWLLIGY